MGEAWIIDTCRTPRGIGKVGKGALAHLHPQHLGATVLKALAERNDLNTAEVDDIVFGCAIFAARSRSPLVMKKLRDLTNAEIVMDFFTLRSFSLERFASTK